MSSQRSAGSSARGLGDLQVPPFPSALPVALAPLHGEGFASREVISAAVSCDPSLEDRIINHVNSRLSRTVESLGRAVHLTGPTTTAGLIVALCLRRWSALRDGPAGPLLLRLVYHSEATAVLAQKLTREVRLEGESGPTSKAGPTRENGTASVEGQTGASGSTVSDPPSGWSSPGWKAFAEGIVHDLGKLALIYSHPEKAAALYGSNEHSSSDRHSSSDGHDSSGKHGPSERGRRGEEVGPRSLEQEVFGCDHTDAGAWAASALGLPDPLPAVTGRHHSADAPAGDAPTGDTATEGEGALAEDLAGGSGTEGGEPSGGDKESGGGKNGEKQDLRVVRAANLLAKTVSPEVAGLRPASPTLDWKACAEDPVWTRLQASADGAAGQALRLEALREEVGEGMVLYTRFFLDLPDVRRLSQFD